MWRPLIKANTSTHLPLFIRFSEQFTPAHPALVNNSAYQNKLTNEAIFSRMEPLAWRGL